MTPTHIADIKSRSESTKDAIMALLSAAEIIRIDQLVRNDIPALLARIEELEEERDRAIQHRDASDAALLQMQANAQTARTEAALGGWDEAIEAAQAAVGALLPQQETVTGMRAINQATDAISALRTIQKGPRDDE